MTAAEAGLLAAGGLVAGIVNTMAGGGSLLTVPLLVLLGLPGTEANATNRVGVLVQSVTATWSFRSEGVRGLGAAAPIVAPMLVGSLVGAWAVAHVDDALFEKVFGLLMVPLVIPAIWPVRAAKATTDEAPSLSGPARAVLFFAIGLYGGAIQAGVGLVLVAALARSGFGLVLSNHIKVAVVAAFTLVAVAVFVAKGQVVWLPALVLAAAASAGAAAGARIAVRGGDRVIRPVLVVAVLALSGRMLGLY